MGTPANINGEFVEVFKCDNQFNTRGDGSIYLYEDIPVLKANGEMGGYNRVEEWPTYEEAVTAGKRILLAKLVDLQSVYREFKVVKFYRWVPVRGTV